jgi:TP901-1 family phage major tail protein
MAKAKKEFRLGIKAKIFYGAAGTTGVPTSELTNVTDVTVTLDAGEADVTSRDNDGFRAMIGGLKECSIEFEMLYLPGDPGLAAIKNAWITGDQIHIAALTGTGGEGPVGDFSVTSFARSEPLEEAIKYSVTLKLSQWEMWNADTSGTQQTQQTA